MAIKKTVTGSGRQRFQVYIHNAALHRQVYVGTFDRRRDAEEAEYEAKRRMRLGEPIKPRPPREEITFTAMSQRWLDSLVAVRPSTRWDYLKAVRRVREQIGPRYVSTLGRRDIDDVIARLAESYAPSTTRKTVTVLKMVLRMAVDHGHIDRLPVGSTRLSLPKTAKRVFEPLTADQVRALIAAVEPPYWRPFVRLLLTSGLRRSEAWGLRLQDLDLQAGVVHVRGQLIKRKLVELKTAAGYRTVPLPKTTVEALRAHLETLPASELQLLFPTPEGKPIDPSNFYARVWIPTREKAGLPKFRMHDCRHHVASVYLSQGRSITYVQRLLGHSNPTTLLSIYSWVTKAEADVATAEFERWFGEEQRSRYGLPTSGDSTTPEFCRQWSVEWWGTSDDCGRTDSLDTYEKSKDRYATPSNASGPPRSTART